VRNFRNEGAASSAPAAHIFILISLRGCGGGVGRGRWESCREPRARFFGMIVERAEASAINDLSGFIDDVEAFRPCCVGVISDVVHVVHGERQGEMESLNEIVGDGHSLREGVRLGVANVLIHVGFHLPFIERMSFADIDGEKVGAVLVIVIERDEVAYLAAEGGSGVTSEDQNQGALPDPFAQVKGGLAVEREQAHIRRVVAYMKITVAPLRKRVTQETVDVARTAH
jgi:hypothetical protein